MLIALVTMCYVATLPSYDFSQWVPNEALSILGIPVSVIWWLNDKADKVAHFFGGFILTGLLLCSNLKIIRRNGKTSQTEIVYFLVILCLAVGAEIVQFQIGRKFSIDDIFVGICGGASAILILKLGTLRSALKIRTN